MEGVALKRIKRDVQFEVDKQCILCEGSHTHELTSTENGRKRIMEAAEIRRDSVLDRLKEVDYSMFKYHMNNECYKKYVLQKSLDKLIKQRKDVEELSDDDLSTIRMT